MGDVMTAECRPPPGTEDGAVCVLRLIRFGEARYQEWLWTGTGWAGRRIPIVTDPSPMAAAGWQFFAIATPEPKP